MSQNTDDRIRQNVRQHYERSLQRKSCCSGSSCCGADQSREAATSCCESAPAHDYALALGYNPEELAAAPLAAEASLGCGNPQGIAELQPGETVVDLGSGAGLDCFLAASRVGEMGQVIGVDMTPDMVSTARHNAVQLGKSNVSFRLGEIEHLPVADGTADVIISNCVINLSPRKAEVFREAYRLLKPGGRLAIADTVATAPLPAEARRDLDLWASCLAGAATIGELEQMLGSAGFCEIRITPKDESREMIRTWAPGVAVTDCIVSAYIEAIKPTVT